MDRNAKSQRGWWRIRGRRLWAVAVLIVLVPAGVVGAVYVRGFDSVVLSPDVRRASHRQMIGRLDRDREKLFEQCIFVGTRSVDKLRAHVLQAGDSGTPVEVWNRWYQLGNSELHQGREEAAITSFERAKAIFPRAADQIPAPNRMRFLFDLGVAYMRMGETQNCCQLTTPDSCIMPIQGQAIHTRREGSENAAACFLEVLRQTSPDDRMHLDCLWLLNVAYMTLGEYPQGVPAEYRLPESMLASDEAFPRFINIAKSVGLDTYSLAGSVIADDFDNDGTLDLVVSSWEPSSTIKIFWNRSGKFVEASRESGLGEIMGGLNMVQTDFNNDGHLDITVFRGGWLANDGFLVNSLIRNNGDGTFSDVTFAAGLGDIAYPTQTGAWADYDLDGDLDLYIGNESASDVPMPGELYRNNGNETFTNVTEEAGVQNNLMAKGVAWGDYDGDRWPDLYVSNFRGPNRLYRNLGNGTFENVAGRLGVEEPQDSFPVWFWDYDNDGALDLYVTAYAGGVAELAGYALGRLPESIPRACLYRNDGQGGFRNVAPELNLVKPHHPMGANLGDLDNDGYLDFYLGTGWPNYHELMPNAMYRNDRGQRFLDVTTAGGFGHLQKAHGVTFVDLDNDGDADVFEQMGGLFRGDRFYNVLFQNPGFGNHWLSIKLVGTKTNRAAMGARIRIDITEDGQPRSIYRWIDSGGTFGANSLEQLIGVGSAVQADKIEVYWPVSDETQTFYNVPIDRWLKITEGENAYEEVQKETFALGEAEQDVKVVKK